MKDPNWRKCVLHADSRDVIKHIPDNSIDFILTDPPYNLGQHSTGNIPLPGRSAMNNDVAEWDMIDFNPEEWAEEFIRILKPTGNLLFSLHIINSDVGTTVWIIGLTLLIL
jgi:DNA modification methylase